MSEISSSTVAEEKKLAEISLPSLTSETASTCDFSQLIVEKVPFLRRIARRWPSTGADSEDLVQDTLLRALSNAHQWQPGTNLRAWLFTIMRNEFLGGKNRSNRADAAMQDYADATPPPILERQEARLLLRDARRVIDRLPKAQRMALLLVGAEGHSHESVAKMLDVSTPALRCHLTR